MASWQHYLSQVIAIHSRAKNMEEALQFTKLFNGTLAPSQVAEKLLLAEKIKKMYVQAKRMCLLLEETQDEDSAADLSKVQHMIDKSLRRIDDILKVLKSKAEKWNLNEDEEVSPETVKMPEQLSMPDLSNI